MSAPWWVVLAAAVIGATAGIAGAVWAARVQRRAANRAEWFRRLQWAWALTRSDDRHDVTAGIVMMEHLVISADRRDVAIIDQVAPITREVGEIAAQYPSESTNVDVSLDDDDTDRIYAGEEDGRHDDK